MKRSVCKQCSRSYWAQVIPVGAMIVLANGKSYFKTAPKTSYCKKHSLPTKTHEPKKRVGARHLNRKSLRRDKGEKR